MLQVQVILFFVQLCTLDILLTISNFATTHQLTHYLLLVDLRLGVRVHVSRIGYVAYVIVEKLYSQTNVSWGVSKS